MTDKNEVTLTHEILPTVNEVRPSRHIEGIVNQQKSAIVEAFKLDNKQVRVIVVENKLQRR